MGAMALRTTRSGSHLRRPFRFVDLFAGIGGFRYALESLGGTCAYSVEKDRFARTSYAANFAMPEGEDIREVSSLPRHDILAAGFPCQPFSIAGVSKKISLGRDHGFLDATQGTLFFELARLIDQAKPPIILLENVKNLVRHDQGRTFEVVRETLEGLGYNVSYQVIDARAWVPQHRERVFVVGLRRDRFGEQRFVFPAPPLSRPTLVKVLQVETDPKYQLSAHLWEYLQRYAEKHRQLGHGFGFGLVGPDDVARTLSARYHKDGSEILIKTASSRPRRLTPLECARLMGFPESIKIVVSDTQAYRQFGNAVVVPVVQHVGAAILLQTERVEALTVAS